MKKNNSLILKNAMNYGAILGITIVIYYLILFFVGINVHDAKSNERYFEYINYFILISGLFITGKKYRDEILNGKISYSQSLGFGTLTGLFASIIIAFYLYIYFKFIDPAQLTPIYNAAEEAFDKQNFDENQIEESMVLVRKLILPFIFIMTIISKTTICFLISLFSSITIKKEEDPFNKAMKEIK